MKPKGNFNPLAPRGARRCPTSSAPVADVISIHSPLAGRDTCPRRSWKTLSEFQSTRPSRGETAKSHKILLTKTIPIAQHTSLQIQNRAYKKKNEVCLGGESDMHRVRTHLDFGVNWRFASKDEWFVHRKGGRYTIVLYFAVIVIAQHIEANAVVRFVHFGAD
mgnify:CR=1 FL=1